MSIKSKNHQRRTFHPRGRGGTTAGKGETVVRAALISFAGGVVFCTALLIAFAGLLANTPIPLTLVRPLSCVAASAGAAVSGFLMAGKMKKQLLLCGLVCGVFWAGCQILASVFLNGEYFLLGANLMLPVALVLGGVLGGALAAARTVR